MAFDVSSFLGKLGGNTGILGPYGGLGVPKFDPTTGQYTPPPVQSPSDLSSFISQAAATVPNPQPAQQAYQNSPVFQPGGKFSPTPSANAPTPTYDRNPFTSGSQSASQTSFPPFTAGSIGGLGSSLGSLANMARQAFGQAPVGSMGGGLASLLMQRRMQDPNGQNPGSPQQLGQGVTGTASGINPYGQSQ